MKPTFERCADATLGETRGTYAQRGTEYKDSWAVENQVSTFTRAAIRDALGIENPSPEAMRLIQAAALVDIKDSRMWGPHKRDTHIDGIAYRALYAQLREEFASAPDVRPAPATPGARARSQARRR